MADARSSSLGQNKTHKSCKETQVSSQEESRNIKQEKTAASTLHAQTQAVGFNTVDNSATLQDEPELNISKNKSKSPRQRKQNKQFKSKYTNIQRNYLGIDLLEADKKPNLKNFDVRDLRNQDYFLYLDPEQQRAQEIVQNFDKLISYKRSAIKEHFKPLDVYYKEHNKKFTTDDLDLIDKAERNMEEKVHGFKR